MRYTIGTGYYNSANKEDWAWDNNESFSRANFFNVWLQNTINYSAPVQIVVVDSSLNAEKPSKNIREGLNWIELSENLGQVMGIDRSGQNIKFGGWSLSFMISALIAYNNKSDFIYKEQDCLAFNSWVNEFYKPHGFKMLVGRETTPMAQIEQSLFWIRWDYIPEFIAKYMSLNGNDGAPYGQFFRPEHKFAHIMRNPPFDIGFFNFGYGRAWPNVFPSPPIPFYLQQISDERLRILSNAKLI